MARTKKQPEQYAITAVQVEALSAAELFDMVRYANAKCSGTVERGGVTYYLFAHDGSDDYALARYIARWRSFGCEPLKLDFAYGTPQRPYNVHPAGFAL